MTVGRRKLGAAATQCKRAGSGKICVWLAVPILGHVGGTVVARGDADGNAHRSRVANGFVQSVKELLGSARIFWSAPADGDHRRLACGVVRSGFDRIDEA